MWHGLMAVVLVGLAVTAAAAEEVTRFEPVVVTATKVATPQRELGASVTVITDEELRAGNQDQLSDALRAVPGVVVQRSGGPGKLATVRIRGSSPQQIQVLVDGLRVKDLSGGTLDFSELSLDGIDRIEVVRGPQSGLYGADAIGGVINIITRKGQGTPHGDVWLQAGSYGTFRESANLLGALGGFNFNVAASRYDSRGQIRTFDNDDSEQTSFTARLGYDFPWKGSLSLTGRYVKTDIDRPIGENADLDKDPNARQQTEVYLLNVLYEQPVTRWWNVSARFGQWWRNLGGQNPPPPPSDADNAILDSHSTMRRREAEVINTFPLAPWTTLTIGGEHREEWGQTRSLLGNVFFPSGLQRFGDRITTTSLFGQDEIRLLDRFFVTGSVRWENSDRFEESLTSRVSAAFVVKETGTKLRATWGEGFRAPAIDDLLFPGFGNPGLEPEHVESYDVGLDQSFWRNRVRIGATYFHNEFIDLFQVVCDLSTGAFVCAEQNVGRARTEGVEFYGEVQPVDWLSAYVTYTHTATLNKITDGELIGFPRHVWNTGVTVAPLERLRLFAQANVVSSQLAFSGRNPGYHRIDVGGTYRLLGRAGHMERLELTARIDNVTDETYEEVQGFPARGLSALVGLRAYFQ